MRHRKGWMESRRKSDRRETHAKRGVGWEGRREDGRRGVRKGRQIGRWGQSGTDRVGQTEWDRQRGMGEEIWVKRDGQKDGWRWTDRGMGRSMGGKGWTERDG